MRGQNPKNVDPLFQLFEHHLLTRSYEDSTAFTKEVAEQYLAYLDSTFAHIPLHLRQTITEDLEQEAHEMLVKKMYGCVRATDYMNYGKVIRVKGSMQFSVFEFTPAAKPDKEESDNSKD